MKITQKNLRRKQRWITLSLDQNLALDTKWFKPGLESLHVLEFIILNGFCEGNAKAGWR